MTSPDGKRPRDNDDGGDGQRPHKYLKLDPDADEQPAPVQAPAQPPPPPPPAQCTICLDALTATLFANDPNQGTITLVCQQGQVPHEFHGACLQDWVYKSSFNPEERGQVIAGVNFWKRLPPRCPNCRARFLAATYWPAYAVADGYPDDGVQYTTQVLADSDSDSDSDSGDDEQPAYAYTTAQDLLDDDSIEPYQLLDDSSADSSDENIPYVATITCSACGIEGPHDEMTADALIAAHGPVHVCTHCPTPIQLGDEQPVLRCRNCGATSHYHD